jgi:gluconate 5-dehydrogenase
MLKRSYGKIINTCSVMSELGRPSIAPYTASKGAVKMMTKQMATEWGTRGIRSNGIAPGYFKTELTDALVKDPTFSAWVASRTPLGRWGNVEELQGACVFLAAPASDYVTGHVLFVDGGLTASV